jgi:hypothetical protein
MDIGKQKWFNKVNYVKVKVKPIKALFLLKFRVEGSDIRGYYAQIALENNDTESLFAIESNIVKSHV